MSVNKKVAPLDQEKMQPFVYYFIVNILTYE